VRNAAALICGVVTASIVTNEHRPDRARLGRHRL